MNENSTLEEKLERMEKARKTGSIIIIACTAVIVITALFLYFSLMPQLKTVTGFIDEAEGLITVAENIDTDALNSALDTFGKLDVDQLNSQLGNIEGLAEILADFDVESLNSAMSALSSLARLFGG